MAESSCGVVLSLTDLPEAAVFSVASYLEPKEYLALSQTAKVFRKTLLSAEMLASYIALQESAVPWEQLQKLLKPIPSYQHAEAMKHIAAMLCHATEEQGAPTPISTVSAPPPVQPFTRPQLQRVSNCSRTPSTQTNWMCAAIGLGRQEAVQALLKEPGVKPDVNYKDGEPLRLAAEQGLTKVVRQLIARGARVDARDNQALARAAGNGHTEAVKALIDAGADVRAGNDRALHAAAGSGSVDTVKLLLDRGSFLESMEGYALRRAAGLGDAPMVRFLLGAGARVDTARNDALFQAARRGRLLVVEMLLEAGADVASCPEAEDIARRRGYKEVAALLANARRTSWVRAPLLAVARMLGKKRGV